jgi:hypothetical protein
MDNCRIHRSSFVVEAMNERGYVLIIEECRVKIKIDIKSNPQDKENKLRPGMVAAC